MAVDVLELRPSKTMSPEKCLTVHLSRANAIKQFQTAAVGNKVLETKNGGSIGLATTQDVSKHLDACFVVGDHSAALIAGFNGFCSAGVNSQSPYFARNLGRVHEISNKYADKLPGQLIESATKSGVSMDVLATIVADVLGIHYEPQRKAIDGIVALARLSVAP